MSESDIRYEDIKRAAEANRRSVAETIEIMKRTATIDRKEHPPEYEPAAPS